MVADGLSALGLYITALQQGAADAARGADAGAAALRPGRAPAGRSSTDVAPHRHRVAARHRRAEAEGPGALRGLEGSARRGHARASSSSAVGDLQRDAAVVVRLRRRAAERGGAAGDQGAPSARPDRRLPARSRASRPTRRPRRPRRRWCSWSTRPAPRSTRSCSRSSSRRRPRWSRTIAESLAAVPRRAARPRGAHHDPPRLPHAQGQRPHGRA